MSDRCRSCDDEVIFVPSAKTGRPMILDAKPTKGVILATKQAEPAAALYVGQIGEFGEQIAAVVDVYTDHHVTCPDAASWKGRKR